MSVSPEAIDKLLEKLETLRAQRNIASSCLKFLLERAEESEGLSVTLKNGGSQPARALILLEDEIQFLEKCYTPPDSES